MSAEQRLSFAHLRGRVASGLPVTGGTLVVMVAAVVFRNDRLAVPASLLLFTAVGWLPLLVRTVWPVPVLVVTLITEAAQLALLPAVSPDWQTVNPFAAFQPVPVATVIAAFTVALHRPGPVGWASSGMSGVVLPGIALLLVRERASEYAFTILVMANLIICGAATGALVAARRQRLAREETERAQRIVKAVEDERLRIARDLHDVVAHHLTLVDAQVSVAAYLVRQDGDAAAAALGGLGRHTRLALDELRATVGLLRGQEEEASPTRPPTPGVDQLPQLVENARAAGAEAKLVVRGEPGRLAPRADVAAYRIAQEAMTNAAKHSPGAPVTVELTWNPSELQLTVINQPPPAWSVGQSRAGTNSGLLGMQERAAAADGTVRHGPTTEGGFCVIATLPTHAQDPEEKL